MKLYHSSYVSVTKPDIIHSRDYLDFGKGFYLTSIHEQAVRYAQRFIRRQREAWLNSYEFEFNSSEWNILKFDSYDKRLAQFWWPTAVPRNDVSNLASSLVVSPMTGLFKRLTDILKENCRRMKH